VRWRNGPGSGIRCVTESEVDLFVIGLPRRTPVGKLVLVSVSQQVLLEAAVRAVLAVKARSR
jgi:hypothetical protein